MLKQGTPASTCLTDSNSVISFSILGVIYCKLGANRLVRVGGERCIGDHGGVMLMLNDSVDDVRGVLTASFLSASAAAWCSVNRDSE